MTERWHVGVKAVTFRCHCKTTFRMYRHTSLFFQLRDVQAEYFSLFCNKADTFRPSLQTKHFNHIVQAKHSLSLNMLCSPEKNVQAFFIEITFCMITHTRPYRRSTLRRARARHRKPSLRQCHRCLRFRNRSRIWNGLCRRVLSNQCPREHPWASFP